MWLWFTGDNYCDDENNNEECEWDGGDCCGYDVSTWFCWACECLDPEEQEGDGGGGCGSPQWKGDNYCDDENNNAECEWDGGDCCGDDISILLCSACECLDPEEQGGGRVSIVENIVEFVNVSMNATMNSTNKRFKMFSFFNLNYYFFWCHKPR